MHCSNVGSETEQEMMACKCDDFSLQVVLGQRLLRWRTQTNSLRRRVAPDTLVQHHQRERTRRPNLASGEQGALEKGSHHFIVLVWHSGDERGALPKLSNRQMKLPSLSLKSNRS